MVSLLDHVYKIFGATNDFPVTKRTDVEKRGQQDPLEEVVGASNEFPYDRFHHSRHRPSKSLTQHQEGIDFKGLVPGPRILSADEQTPSYRILPIFSGVMIPFSLLLSIPGLTGHWYIQTFNNVIIESKPNSPLLKLAMGFSLTCVVLANICLVVRFAERYIKRATFLCIVFLLLHDLINIPMVTVFGVTHRFDDGFTYGQPFWMTVCATVVSTVTNITLIIDFHRTSDFSKSGSGLTHKQRSLVIIIIILLAYLALGSLVQAIMLKIDFIDALYFCVVSIEVIGFGDIVPESPGSRVFTCFYIVGGILNLALLVSTSRAAILEAAALNLQGRIQTIRAGQRRRRVRGRWRAAIKWRLQAKQVPLWVSHKSATDSEEHLHRQLKTWNRPSRAWHWALKRITEKLEDPAWRYVSGPHHTRLNLEALTEAQLEAAALEAGASLDELLPACLMPGSSSRQDGDYSDPTNTPHPVNSPQTHGFTFGQSNLELKDFHAPTINDMYDDGSVYPPDSALHGVPFSRSTTIQDEAALAESLEVEEKNAFHARLFLSFLLFLIFWVAGSLIFMKTEGWSFGTAVYFCFIAFTTVGYGDITPRTPAGRTIFVVWALLGVGTMTILISILVEACSTQYQKSIKSQLYQLTSKSQGISTESVTTIDMTRRSRGSRTIVNTYTRTDTLPPSSPTPISGSHLPPNLGSRVVSFETPSPRTANIQQGWSNVAAIQETNSIAAEALPRHVMRHADELRALIARNLPDHGASGVYPVHKLPSLFADIEKSLHDITVVAQNALKGADGQTLHKAS